MDNWLFFLGWRFHFFDWLFEIISIVIFKDFLFIILFFLFGCKFLEQDIFNTMASLFIILFYLFFRSYLFFARFFNILIVFDIVINLLFFTVVRIRLSINLCFWLIFNLLVYIFIIIVYVTSQLHILCVWVLLC